MKYRSDIDGLRTIAVMSVILAHAGITAISGGFLGVDVFFAISGYLITTILIRELDAGTYSLITFYERRARRILPALLVVIIMCVPFAIWLMLPEFLKNFGQSIVATLLFSNNLLLAKTSGYWDLESAFKPLLHTWSLGVEEQYYILFPILLAALWRFGRKTILVAIAIVACVSFAVSEHGWRIYPTVSFYLPSSRAWELMIGSLAAFVPRRERFFDQYISLAGLSAVIFPMFLFTEHTPSPSYYSAVPVFGATALLLFNNPGTLSYRILSFPPMVFIGIISYSAYLWHQPLFAFARIARADRPSTIEMWLLVVVTLGLATLSWRFIETPFRNRTIIPMRRFLAITIPATVGAVSLGLALHFYQGFPRWTFPNVANPKDVSVDYNERAKKYKAQKFPDNGKANIAILGNSYGRDAVNIIIEGGAAENKNLIYLEGSPACHNIHDYKNYAPEVLNQADAVVIAIDQHLFFDSEDLRAVRAQEVACYREAAAILKSMLRVPIIFVGSKQFGMNINVFGRIPMSGRSIAMAQVPTLQSEMNNDLANALPKDEFINLIHVLGGDGRSIHFYDGDGNPLSQDRNHLTRYGARYAAKVLNATNPTAWVQIKSAHH